MSETSNVSLTGRWIAVPRESFACLGIILIGCLVLGWLATRLNNHFYDANQPFYDSISYNSRTHHVMTLCREQGLSAALSAACIGDTVCLPFLIAAVAGVFFEPSRHVGIWIQSVELAVFCMTAWIYFSKVQKLSARASLAVTAPFLLLRCLYMNNGGLSDYRMDLSLAILFGTTCLWYLIASRGNEQWPYWLLGISCAATCLFRGTAPVYFVFAMGPVVLWDLAFLRRDRFYLRGLSTAFGLTVLLSAWFFIVNFSTLYYYYFVWNTDANAHLPLAESVRHFRFVYEHIGGAAILYLIAFQVLVVISRCPNANNTTSKAWANFCDDLRGIDLRPLWIGIAPALFLTLRGAGLNPFVCMPSVLGLYLFALIPVPFKRGLSLNVWSSCILFCVFALCSVNIFQQGWKNHDGDSPNSMAAHQQTLDIIVNDMKLNKFSQARFATTHSYFLNTQSLESVAIFDRAGTRRSSDAIQLENTLLRPDFMMSLSAEADWARTPGGTDDDKVAQLAAKASEVLDYLVLPTQECSILLRDRVAHNVVNRFAVQLREQLLSKGNWELISPEICNRADETVQIFRNRGNYLARHSTATIR